jgi:hypothetical protein
MQNSVSNSNLPEHLKDESPPIGGGTRQSIGAAMPAQATEEENQ